MAQDDKSTDELSGNASNPGFRPGSGQNEAKSVVREGTRTASCVKIWRNSARISSEFANSIKGVRNICKYACKSMAEEEDKKAGIFDWGPLHSPTTLFSSCVVEDFNNSRSFSQLLSGHAIESPLVPEPKFSAVNSSSGGGDNKGDPFTVAGGLPAGAGGFASGLRPPARVNGGSFADRMAARSGFNAPRLNTARFKSAPPSGSPVARSPYLTIPPGLSPTTLLDSPVLLSNSLAEQSPTTGTFTSPPLLSENAVSAPLTSGSDGIKEKSCEDGNSSLFAFKPYVKSGPNPCLSPLGGLATHGSMQQQILAGFQPSVQAQSYAHIQAQGQAPDEAKVAVTSMTTKELVDDPLTQQAPYRNYGDEVKCIAPLRALPPGFTPDHAAVSEQQQQNQVPDAQLQFSEGHQKAPAPQNVTGRPSEDGYNWRKYGQKQVKGSEYPRSYYKCTHPNCQMKKKVERSHDGQITEIVYKGIHNHSKPQPSRRSAVSAAHMNHEGEDRTEGSTGIIKIEGGSTWRSTQLGLLKDTDTADSSQGWKNEGLERSSSASVVTDLSDPSSAVQGQSSIRLESLSTPEPSSILASDDDGEDGGTQGCKSLGDDVGDDESDSKRRKKESNNVDIIAASRTVREPRVVVQTTSEIDILDDGYRWRKYGQKVVKGNPNPRSYYKCTNAGCPVRKHVERASHDLKAVITTYEGKHNHDVPAARNSNHDNAGRGNAPSGPATQNNVTGTMDAMVRSGPQVQDNVSRFDGHSEFGNEYGKCTYFGRVANDSLHSQDKNAAIIDLKMGAGMGFGMLGVDNRHGEKWQTAEAPTSFSMQIHGSPDLGLSGVELNGGKHTVPVQSYFVQAKENDSRLLRPKEEQTNDAGFGNLFPLNNSSNSVYHQIMGRLSMGL